VKRTSQPGSMKGSTVMRCQVWTVRSVEIVRCSHYTRWICRVCVYNKFISRIYVINPTLCAEAIMLCELLVCSYAESTLVIKGRCGQVCVCWWTVAAVYCVWYSDRCANTIYREVYEGCKLEMYEQDILKGGQKIFLECTYAIYWRCTLLYIERFINNIFNTIYWEV